MRIWENGKLFIGVWTKPRESITVIHYYELVDFKKNWKNGSKHHPGVSYEAPNSQKSFNENRFLKKNVVENIL